MSLAFKVLINTIQPSESQYLSILRNRAEHFYTNVQGLGTLSQYTYCTDINERHIKNKTMQRCINNTSRTEQYSYYLTRSSSLATFRKYLSFGYFTTI